MSKPILYSLCLVGCFTAGLLFGLHVAGKKPPVKIVEEKVIYKTIERNYQETPLATLQKELKCYDTAKPLLDISPIDARHFKIEAGLCKRTWSRDIMVDCGSEGNWKLYLGIGIGVAGAAAITYGLYKLTR